MAAKSFGCCCHNSSCTKGVKESFNKEEYYADFPVPWNVIPRDDMKTSDEIQQIDSLLRNRHEAGQLRAFDGTEDHYFDWRTTVISVIHRSNLRVEQKCQFLLQTFEFGKDDSLDLLVRGVIPSASGYLKLICQLE